MKTAPALADTHVNILEMRVKTLNDARLDLIEACAPTLNMEMWTESASDDEVVLMSVGTIRNIRNATRKALGANNA